MAVVAAVGVVGSAVSAEADVVNQCSYCWNIAFQGGNGRLWIMDTGVAKDMRLAMLRGTSPGVTVAGNGERAVAFQGRNGNLWFWDARGGRDSRQPMAPGTSPSIMVGDGPAVSAGSSVVAFQGRNRHLWTWSPASGAKDWGRSVDAGSSPSIAFGAGQYNKSEYDIAFSSGGMLTIARADGSFVTTSGPVAKGTSPNIRAELSYGTYDVTFQWDHPGAVGTIGYYRVSLADLRDEQVPMMAGTSPSFERSFVKYCGIVYQGPNGHYFRTHTYSIPNAWDSGIAMMAGASPV